MRRLSEYLHDGPMPSTNQFGNQDNERSKLDEETKQRHLGLDNEPFD